LGVWTRPYAPRATKLSKNEPDDRVFGTHRLGRYNFWTMAANEHTDHELVVADDGSIPAEQLARLGVAPGAHLRVVQAAAAEPADSFAGSLPDFPDLSWEDFQRGSELARSELPSA